MSTAQGLRRIATIAVIAGLALVSWRLPGRAQTPTFTFAAAGDFTDGSNFHATANAVQARKPAFVLALGDLSYNPFGEEAWCKYWLEQLGYRNILLIAGNHDTGESPGGSMRDYLKHCGNPFPKLIKGRYGYEYYFDYPEASPLARFIMLTPGLEGDTGGVDTDYRAGRAGFEFTEKAIKEAKANGIQWIVVGMHKNYISTMVKRNEISTDAKRTFMTLLLDSRVDVVLQGHEHGYERSKQIATNPASCPLLPTDVFQKACVVDQDDDLVKGAGTVIHVIGTAGKDMRKVETGDSEYEYFVKKFADKNLKAFGFGSFNVSQTQLSFEYVRSKGPEFADRFTITQPPPKEVRSHTLDVRSTREAVGAYF